MTDFLETTNARLEIAKTTAIKDTVRLPLTEGGYIHLETSTDRLARSFGDFADQFGRDREEAVEFFKDHVDFQFKNADKVSHFDARLDNLWVRIVSAIQGSKVLGTVSQEGKEKKYTLCVDISAIANVLPGKIFEVKRYSDMTPEEKIAAFKQVVKSVTEHEFYHLLQCMEKPKMMQEASKRVKWSYRLLLGFIATSTTMSLIPELRPAIIPATIPIMGAILYLNKSGVAKVEPDAYEAQKEALKLNIKSPYDFTHENYPSRVKY